MIQIRELQIRYLGFQRRGCGEEGRARQCPLRFSEIESVAGVDSTGSLWLAASEFTALINSNLFPDSLNQTQDVKVFSFLKFNGLNEIAVRACVSPL